MYHHLFIITEYRVDTRQNTNHFIPRRSLKLEFIVTYTVHFEIIKRHLLNYILLVFW